MVQICEWCKKEYINTRSHSKTRFCSRSCAVKRQYAHGLVSPTVLAKKGWQDIRNSGRTRFKKGTKPWNTDTKGVLKANAGSFKKIYIGTRSEYRRVHYWIKKQRGFPEQCEFCKEDGLTGRFIHWANKSGEYKYELSDWLRLCHKCHKLYDRKYERTSI